MYFCIEFQGHILGSINFKIQENACVEYGFFSNPYLKVGGLGRILEQISLYYAFNILKAKALYCEVLKENHQVINLHKKFGFEILKDSNEHIIKFIQHSNYRF